MTTLGDLLAYHKVRLVMGPSFQDPNRIWLGLRTGDRTLLSMELETNELDDDSLAEAIAMAVRRLNNF